MKITNTKKYLVQNIFYLIVISAISSTGQSYLAVMDLVSDGSVSKSSLITISDKISQSVNESKYSQFDRTVLPELLKQFNMDDSTIACYDPQCLILIGNLIGANAVIGGILSRNNDFVNIKLNLVDASNKITLNTVSIKSASPKTEFLETEIPELVNRLFSGPQNVQSTVTDNSKTEIPSFNSKPLSNKNVQESQDASFPSKKTGRRRPAVLGTIGGLVFSGIVGLAVYTGLNNDSNSEGKTPPLSMDDAPKRVRSR